MSIEKIFFGSVFTVWFVSTLFTPQAFAIEYVWTNSAGDNNYNNSYNWAGGVLPAAESNNSKNRVIIGHAGSDKAVFSDGLTPNLGGLYVGFNGTDGEIEQTGGTLNFAGPVNSCIGGGSAGNKGTFTMSGGSASINALVIGVGEEGHGNLIIKGGDLTILRTYNGASLAIDASKRSASASVEISGGSLLTRTGVTVGDKGTFSVLGSGATQIGIGSFESGDGYWKQATGSTLRVRIANTPVGISKIFIDDTGSPKEGDGDVTFEKGALLDVGFLDAKVEGQWDIMTWEGTLTDHGLTLASGVDLSVWSFEFVDTDSSGSPDTLRVKAKEGTDTGVSYAWKSTPFREAGDFASPSLVWR